MSVTAVRPSHLLRPRLAFLAVVAGLVALSSSPAEAVEKKAFGDVTVREPVEEVLTAVGDVVVEAPVSDDVHAGLGDVTVRERVGGDVEAVNGDVRIGAPVGGAWGPASATFTWKTWSRATSTSSTGTCSCCPGRAWRAT